MKAEHEEVQREATPLFPAEEEEEESRLSPLRLEPNDKIERTILSAGNIPGQPRRLGARRIETFLFFLSGVGSTVGWTAVLSNLVFYSETLGRDSYLYLNAAVYVPLLPVTMAQARWDSLFDRRYNSLFAFSFRGVVGFAVSVVTVALMPLVSFSLVALSFMTLILGTASSVLHGTMKQMASFIYPDCKTLPAAVTAGMQASAALVLVVSVATGFGGSKTSTGIISFYSAIAAIALLCWGAFSFLMWHSHDVINSMRRRDSSMGMERRYSSIESLEEPLLLEHEQESPEEMNSSEQGQDEDMVLEFELSNWDLWTKTWPACVSLMVTVASSMSVASWFNRITSTDPTNQSLPQVLFYTRLFSDLLGRPATLLVKPKSLWFVGVVAGLRVLFVPLFFLYASSVGEHSLPRSDAAITLGVACFSFTSGYVATACYQLAPELLVSPDDQRFIANSFPKQTSLVNVCFSASILIGLSLSFALLGAGI